MVPKFIPTLLKHCTMAIYDKGSKTVTQNWFEQSFTIARTMLARQGYLTDTSIEGSTSAIRLTAKGMMRNSQHAKEGSGSNGRFNRLYEQYIEQESAKMPHSRDGATHQDRNERAADMRLSDNARTALSAQDRRRGEQPSLPQPKSSKVPRQVRPTSAPGRALKAPRGRSR